MLDTVKIFDPHKFNEQTLGVTEVKVEIKRVFLKQTPEISDAILVAIGNRELHQLMRLLHKLKSSVGLFCQSEFAQELNYLEKSVEAEFDNPEFRKRLDKMMDNLTIMLREVEAFPVT